jgi:RNA polymerase sigma-70 factor (ECF subfamily)
MSEANGCVRVFAIDLAIGVPDSSERPIAAALGDVVDQVVGASRASRDVAAELEKGLAVHRAELIGYCSRMLGSRVEAEDAVQETLMRAWRGCDRFEGRAALRSWLYRIATNVCFDHMRGRRRRARPIDFGPGGSAEASLRPPLQPATWIAPAADARALAAPDPADAAISREDVRLAFAVALRRLRPRQRAVLILREVLRWQAKEVADLLGVSVPSVNSTLQRARATLAAGQVDDAGQPTPLDDVGRDLITRFVDAFARHDVDALVAVLSEDVTHATIHRNQRSRGALASSRRGGRRSRCGR